MTEKDGLIFDKFSLQLQKNDVCNKKFVKILLKIR